MKSYKAFKVIIGALLSTVILLNIYIYQSRLHIRGEADAMLAKTNKTNMDIDIAIPNEIDNGSNTIEAEARKFVKAAFDRDVIRITYMLDDTARYISNQDDSSFIRNIEDGIHTEGYLATDKTLISVYQKWYVLESNGNAISCIEIYTREDQQPIYWYLHFKKSHGQWRVRMIENKL